jgi:molybdenum cofactor sulfurtransferase
VSRPTLRVDEDLFPRYLTDTVGDHHNLFAYPAHSNFSGVQHPLEWIEQAHTQGWDVLLDAARTPVVLRRHDRGGLRPAPVLPVGPPAPSTSRTAPSTTWACPRSRSGCASLSASESRLIHARVRELGAWLLDALGSLEQSDGSPAATIYGPRSWSGRGATIAFNFLHPDGRVVDERYVDRVEHNVSLRTGCFCNPGAGEVAFTISREALVGGEFGQGTILDDYVRAIGLPSGGAVRASLGLASNFADVHRFLVFAAEFIDLTDVPDDLPPRTSC